MAPPPADASAQDHYRALGVERGATDAEIAKAYKKLALKHHPDKNPGGKEKAEAKFRNITEAYEVLRDPEKRRQYDAFGLEGPRGGAFAGHGGVSASRADEIFNAFFGVRMGGDFRSPPAAGRAAGAAAEGVPWGSERFVFDLQGGRGRRSGGGGVGAPTPAAAPHAKPPRTRVVVHGLAKSPEHNGKTGEISRWDEARERYEVQLEGGGVLSLRPQSVTQLCAVEVAGLESKPELNGSRGRVFNFDEASGRYMVLLDSPAMAVSLQPGNCVLLDPGARVLLQGLSSCPQLNGQMAQVLGVDREAARYTVRCQGGKHVKVRYDSVVC